jgi:hypothetical protein
MYKQPLINYVKKINKIHLTHALNFAFCKVMKNIFNCNLCFKITKVFFFYKIKDGEFSYTHIMWICTDTFVEVNDFE